MSLFRKINFLSTPSRKRATFFQAVGGYVNTGIVIIQGLLMMPLYIYYLGADVYGLWLASGGILGMLALINFGVSSMLIQRIASAYGEKDYQKLSNYFVNGIIVYISICVLMGVLGWSLSFWVPSILGVEGELAQLLLLCFRIAVLNVVLAVINECLRSFSQALLRPILPHVSTAIGRVAGIGVAFWMLLNDFGLWAIPISLLVSEGLIFGLNLLNAVYLFKNLSVNFRIDRNIIVEYFRTGPVLLLATFGNRVSQEAEPLLITTTVGPEMTTAYMVTRRAADVVFQLLNVLVGSIMGSFAHFVSDQSRERGGSVAKKLFIISISLGTIGFSTYISANHSFVNLWVGESVVLDQVVVLFVALGLFARTFRGLASQILYELSDFTFASVVILAEGIFRLLMSFLLLLMFGVLGVPIGLFLACVVTGLLLGLRVLKLLRVSFSLFLLVKLLLSCLSIFGLAFYLSFNVDSWFNFVLCTLAVSCVVSISYLIVNFSMTRNIVRTIFPMTK